MYRLASIHFAADIFSSHIQLDEDFSYTMEPPEHIVAVFNQAKPMPFSFRTSQKEMLHEITRAAEIMCFVNRLGIVWSISSVG